MQTLTFSNILVNLTHLNFELVLVLVFSKIIIKPSPNGAFNHKSCKETKVLIKLRLGLSNPSLLPWP